MPTTKTKAYQRIPIATETNAPMPVALAVLGLLSFQTKNKIKPTMGIPQPKSPQPIPPLSTIGGVDICDTPQLGQITALSSI